MTTRQEFVAARRQRGMAGQFARHDLFMRYGLGINKMLGAVPYYGAQEAQSLQFQLQQAVQARHGRFASGSGLCWAAERLFDRADSRGYSRPDRWLIRLWRYVDGASLADLKALMRNPT